MRGPIPERWSGYLRSLLRIVAAFLFMAHGTQKLFAWPIDEPRDPAQLLSLMGLAGGIELVGGLCITLGVLTSYAAFIASGEMAMAYFTAHAPRSFWPLENKGELAVLYCFLFLYMAARGSGIWSLERRLYSVRPASGEQAPYHMTTSSSSP